MLDTPPKSKKPSLQVSIHWQVCAFTLFFLPLLLYLGFWQLERAEQKRTIQQFADTQQALAPQPIANVVGGVEELDSLLYRRVQASGRFESRHFWLLENRSYRGRNGFHVLVPFYINTGEIVLVNRGWVAGTGYRDRLPEVSIPIGERQLVGQLVRPSENSLLSEAKNTSNAWPKTSLEIDMADMSIELGKPLLPWVFQIDKEDPSALSVQWTVVNVPVVKHLGYAYQWFAMAFALVILTIFASTNLTDILRRSK